MVVFLKGNSLASQLQTALGQISMCLVDNGLPSNASVEEQLLHLWRQLLDTETKLHSTTEELEALRTQQAKEMEEVNAWDSLDIQCKTIR